MVKERDPTLRNVAVVKPRPPALSISVSASVHNFVSAVWDKEEQNAILCGRYDKFRR